MPRSQRRFRGRMPDSKDLLAQLLAKDESRFGVPLQRTLRGTETVWCVKGTYNEYHKTKHEALRSYFRQFGRKYGWKRPYTMRHVDKGGGHGSYVVWELRDHAENLVERWLVRPLRAEIAHAIKRHRRNDSAPSYTRADTLGWRTFGWHPTQHCLMSPVQGTMWTEPEMRVENWNEHGAVRGASGIHACRLPKGDWRKAAKPHDMPHYPILALVERFGKFVLGSEGWRAEWVFIKEIMAPDEATGRALRRVYPEIPVCVADRGHWLRGGV